MQMPALAAAVVAVGTACPVKFPSPFAKKMKEIPIIIFGIGGVGQALIHQILNSRQRVAQRNQCQLNIVALIDSRNWLYSPTGLTDEQIHELLAAKQTTPHQSRRPHQLNRPDNVALLSELAQAGLGQAIVADVTAADGMETMVAKALEMGHGVVLANKKPLATPWSVSQPFFNHPRLRHESTVGGGQPVIATLRYLMDTNDPISRIEGQLSGTLGFVCRQMDDGLPFSVALGIAKAKGYTEPDPREDLGGKDVMRKLLILGRMAGWAMEESDIQVESLYHPALAHLPVAEFMSAAVAMDPALQDRVRAAAAAGEVLRYVAELEHGHASVGLVSIPQESPMANLKYVSFRTRYYDNEPLLIGGKGAGVDMTAAGVLGDLIGLAREMFGSLTG